MPDFLRDIPKPLRIPKTTGIKGKFLYNTQAAANSKAYIETTAKTSHKIHIQTTTNPYCKTCVDSLFLAPCQNPKPIAKTSRAQTVSRTTKTHSYNQNYYSTPRRTSTVKKKKKSTAAPILTGIATVAIIIGIVILFKTVIPKLFSNSEDSTQNSTVETTYSDRTIGYLNGQPLRALSVNTEEHSYTSSPVSYGNYEQDNNFDNGQETH